jgi:hypothetical protein
MEFFIQSRDRYPDQALSCWRINDKGVVHYRHGVEDVWNPALVLFNHNEITRSLLSGEIEKVMDDPFKKYDCLNDIGPDVWS